MAAFMTLLCIGIAMLPVVLYSRRRSRLAIPGDGPSPWVYVAGLLPATLFFAMFAGGSEVAVPILILIGCAGMAFLGYLWVREIVNLMGLSDDAFPGRHDKALWLALMVLLPLIGVPAFCIFRRAYWPAEKPMVDSVTREMA